MSQAAQMAPVPAPTGGVGKSLLEIFYSPASAFTRIGPKSWWVPMLATILIGLVGITIALNVVGLETIVRNQLESNPRMVEQLGQQKINEMAAEAGNSTPRKVMTYAMVVVGSVIMLLVIAGALTLGNMITGADIRFGTTLGIVALAVWAYSVVRTVASSAVLLMVNDFEGFDFENSVPLNPSLFLNRAESPGWLYSMVSSFDLLSFWGIFLIGLGLHQAAPRVSLGKSIGMVAVFWVLWVLVKAGFASLF